MRRTGSVHAFVLAALAASAPGGAAHANGAFPNAGQVLVDPTDATRIWVRTSFGFALSTDAGETFDLVCKEGLGYDGVFHAHAAVSSTGALFMGVQDGLIVGRGDMCSFDRAPELEGLFLVDVSIDPAGTAVALAVDPSNYRTRVFRSFDDLATWTEVSGNLPMGLVPETIDPTATDPDVIYVSGVNDDNPPRGVIVRSLDGGEQWDTFEVPGSESVDEAPYIGGVAPDDPGRLFVRLGGDPGRLLESNDYGETFQPILLELPGVFYAFRLSADGTFAYVGTDTTGLRRLDLATLELEQLSPIHVRCVTLDGERVLACASQMLDGFSAGVSADGGVTFDPLLSLPCLRGILACPAGSPVEAGCEPLWPAIENQIAVFGECDPTGGGGGGGASSQGGAAQGGAAQGGANGNGGTSSTGNPNGGGGGGGNGDDGDTDDGCSCGAVGGEPAPAPILAGALLLLLRRRAKRR